MFLRTADLLEMAQSLYPVSSILGNALQLLALAVHKKELNQLLNAMQKFGNKSNISKFYDLFVV